MQDLFDRGWFTRTWTIQEVALASNTIVMCGEKTILWGHLMGGFDVAFNVDNTERTRSARNAVQCIQLLWLCLLKQSWDDNDARFYGLALKTLWTGSKKTTLQRLRRLKKMCVCSLLMVVVDMAIDRLGRSHWRLENKDLDAWIFVVLLFSLVFVMAFLDPPQEIAESRQQLLRETLNNIVNLVRMRDVTDRRDKVFALYGIFKALGIALDDPEYRHSTVADVYLGFTRRVIEWQNNLDLLVEASLPPYPGSPTWVPDLSRAYRRWDVQMFRATKNSAPSFTHSSELLKTTGMLLGRVGSSWERDSSYGIGFATSDEMYKGISSGPVQVGDLVVLISGLRAPMVVRQVSKGYQVVGVAEVEGIMSGEAWNDKVPKHVFDLV